MMHRPGVRIVSLLVLGAGLLSNVPVRGQLASVAELIVVDSAGTKVGRAFNPTGQIGSVWSSWPIVAIDVQGHLILLRVAHNRLFPDRQPQNRVYFASADCTGPPLIRRVHRDPNDPPPAITIDAAIGPPGRTIYVPEPGATGQLTVPRSFWEEDTDSCASPSVGPGLVRALALANLEDYFTPPFRVVSAPAACCGDCNADGEVRVDELVTGVNRLLFGCAGSNASEP